MIARWVVLSPDRGGTMCAQGETLVVDPKSC